jgi:hypothetical protein
MKKDRDIKRNRASGRTEEEIEFDIGRARENLLKHRANRTVEKMEEDKRKDRETKGKSNLSGDER